MKCRQNKVDGLPACVDDESRPGHKAIYFKTYHRDAIAAPIQMPRTDNEIEHSRGNVGRTCLSVDERSEHAHGARDGLQRVKPDF